MGVTCGHVKKAVSGAKANPPAVVRAGAAEGVLGGLGLVADVGDDVGGQLARALATADGIDLREPRPHPLRLKRIKVSGKDNQLAFIMRVRGGKRGLAK